MPIDRTLNPWNSSLPSPDLVPQYRGEWTAIKYQKADIVTKNGNMYIALVNPVASQQPGSDPTVWKLVLPGNTNAAEFDEIRAVAEAAITAVGNLTLAELNTKSQRDGPQLVDGSRWIWKNTGTINGGTVVAALDGGFWHREYVGEVSAAWFGAKGDNVTDDYAALQAWATVGSSLGYGGRLYLPPGNYRTSQTIIFRGEYLVINAQGIIRPYETFTGYLVRIGPDSAADGSNIQDSSIFGTGIWQKRLSVENLTLDCEWKCRGVQFQMIDHFENSRVYVRRSLGVAVGIDRCREGDWYGLKMYHCQQGSDRAILDFYDADPGDSNNTMSFYGLEIVWNHGKSMSIDSSPTTLSASGYFPPRFINFFGIHIEDIFKSGLQFGSAGRLVPNPTVDIIHIRRGYHINFFGGTLNSGDISTGSVIRFGEVGLSDAVRRCVLDNVNIFAFDASPGAVAVKCELSDDIDLGSVNWWLGANISPISYGEGSNKLPTDKQGKAYTVPSSDAAVSVRGSNGTTDSPAYEMVGGQGFGGNIRHRYSGGLGRVLLNPDYSVDHSFALDHEGHIYSEGNSKKRVWIGKWGGDEASGIVLYPHTSNPSVATGAIVLCQPPGFNPLGREGTKSYLARFNGTSWESVD